ncbi:MAG: TonB-dependent receptor plug domain-containing protein [Sandaracinaceae bacterium]
MRALADPVRVSPPYGARTTARALATAVATGGWLIARLALGQPAPEQTPVDREASDRDPEADEETPITLGDLLDEVDDEVDPDRVEVDDLVDPERELAIPDVVVTGSRIEQSRAGSAVHVEVIRRDEIEQSGARDAAELLEERAGLQLVRSFRGTELWLRGMDPQYTLVLVDGDRVPGQIGGAIDLSRYGVENIERVELVRGPSSALYGSDAIGGVVNLITRDVDRDFEAEAVAAYGLNNVVDAMGRVAGRPDPHVQLRLDGGFHYADAFRRGATDGATSGSSRMQWSLGGRADWNPSASQRFRVQGDYLQLTLQGVDEGAGSALFERTQVQEQLRVSVEHTLRGPQGLSLLTRVSYNQFREQYLNDQIGSQQLDDYQDNREQMGQLTTLVHYDLVGLGTHGLTAGFEELFQLLSSERLSRAGERSRFAVFAQDEWVPWEEGDASLTIVPGLRYDVDSQFGDQMSPKLSVRFDPVSQLVLRAAYGRGFRAPSFQQLLLRFENPTVGYVVYGNPDLGAETSHGVDVGAEWRPIDELSF